jgi:spermidine/putrescine transport system ATP-binding protein
MAERQHAVEVQGVSKRFGATLALDDVSLAVRPGEFLSLLGPSGCGKTTLLRIIAGFESPTSGRVSIDGADVTGLPPYGRPTNMIFQHLALFPHMSVRQNIAFGLRMKKRPAAEVENKVKAALQLVQLDAYGERLPDQLSGGQKQRVAMARAMVNDPSVLLLDEPLGSLDLQLRLQMQVELRRLHKSLGNTFIFVTHDQTEAMTMSDRVAVFNAGRIVQLGTPEEIYERPKARFVAQFVGHTNLLEGRVTAVDARRICTVDIGKGTLLQGLAADGIGAGASVVVSLRYEKGRVNGHAQDGVPGFRGRVTELIYMGAVYRVLVATDCGREITADVPVDGDSKQIASGQAVHLAWHPADAAVIVN